MMALVDPNIDQCEGDVSSVHMGIETFDRRMWRCTSHNISVFTVFSFR